MPSIELILITVLACLVVLFAVLWMRVRRSDTHTDEIGLPSDTECTLLAINHIDIAGVRRQYGVVSVAGRAIPFLIAQNMEHLSTGSEFIMRNGYAYKVEDRKASGDSPAGSVQSQQPVQPVKAARVNQATQQDAEDVANRTVVVLEDRNDEALPLEQAFPFLEVVEGADIGTRFPLPYGDAGIGRGDDNVVALSDNGASRQHCRVEYTDTDFVLCDQNSTNGTFLNGEEITEPRLLEFGDRIEVSDSAMIFSCEGYLLKDDNPGAAIDALKQCLNEEPDFLQALKNLAFLLERDISRKKEAEPIWERISLLEKAR